MAGFVASRYVVRNVLGRRNAFQPRVNFLYIHTLRNLQSRYGRQNPNLLYIIIKSKLRVTQYVRASKCKSKRIRTQIFDLISVRIKIYTFHELLFLHIYRCIHAILCIRLFRFGRGIFFVNAIFYLHTVAAIDAIITRVFSLIE